MEKKRSLGVAVFSWLIILAACLNLLFFGASFKVNPPIVSYVYLIAFPAYLAAAIFLLKLRRWARVAVIVISALIVIATLVTSGHVIEKSQQLYRPQVEQELNKQLKALAEKMSYIPTDADAGRVKAMAVSSINRMTKVLIAMSVIFHFLPILFFTHYNVRQQFKQAANPK